MLIGCSARFSSFPSPFEQRLLPLLRLNSCARQAGKSVLVVWRLYQAPLLLIFVSYERLFVVRAIRYFFFTSPRVCLLPRSGVPIFLQGQNKNRESTRRPRRDTRFKSLSIFFFD